MSGAFGKQSLSIKKENTSDSALLNRGVKKLKFAHKFTSGGLTSFSFSALNTPSDMTANGFIQPSTANILAAQLGFYKDNVEVFSSLNGKLLEYVTYTITNSQVTFINGYTSTLDEIIVVSFDQNVRTGQPIVDGRPLVATGVLTLGLTDFNVGQVYKVNNYPSYQIGEIMVFKDGVLQFRNTGNATADPAADGNYQEVHASGGYGVIVRFNEAEVMDTNIIVVSMNLLVEKPEISMMQNIENTQGQLDAIIPTVAALAGVPESTFRSAPNNVDLRAFGDRLVANESTIDSILDVEVPYETDWEATTIPLSAVTTAPTLATSAVVYAYMKRSGDTLHLRYQMRETANTGAAAGSGIYLWKLPGGLAMDLTKITPYTTGLLGQIVGQGKCYNQNNAQMIAYDSTSLMMMGIGASSANYVSDSWSPASDTTQYYSFTASVPIAGWKTKDTIRTILGL